MKINIKKVLLGLSLTTVIGACTKLEQKNYNQFDQGVFYNNQNEVISAVLRPYTHTNAWATSTDHRSWWKVSELSADQLAWPQKGVDGYDGGVWIRLHHHDWSSDDEIARNPWALMYVGIGYCNTAIENISRREATAMGITEEDKSQYLAELKLLRAMYYMRTMDMYGNIPYVTSTTEVHPKTMPRAQVYDSIETSIKENINLVPILSDANKGRISRAAGYAILAELYLNGEVWSGKPRWQDCVAACDSLILNKEGNVTGTMQLDSTVTQTYSPNNNRSQEQIFSILYNYQTAAWVPGWPGNFYHFRQNIVYGGNRTGNNGIVAIPGVYGSYDNDDKRKKEWFFIGPMWGYLASTGQDNADHNNPMLGIREYNGKQIVFVDAIKKFSTLPANATSADSAKLVSDMENGEENSGVRINKWRLGASTNARYNSTSWVVYRLTWIYFAKAEALMRLNGGSATPEAVDLVNAVRKRAFDPSLWTSKLYTTGTLTMDSLLAERGREFITEGYRRQDLIRFNKFVTTSWWDHTASGDKNKELFAVPLTQLGLNSNLEQNPGY
ncbi:MAG: RagB/SusD family nutrient uptake outer membrane protein [Pseudopedobacter saltans]|uniref:RagB/SusD family nutrient uptake outer membrane protein n=1 Tax=Pseudopedobacter saltans TaxID=151895 RepID=A0A2W5FDM1_9SPHI|nr:MAG: RagB/SusD family nutrient uptake outer membrane protein [Pseudopedobacter saltans]